MQGYENMYRHVGMTNTGQRCVVIMLQLRNEDGTMIDDQKCLVVNTDSLPDRYHQNLMELVRDRQAQALPELYPFLQRRIMPDTNQDVVTSLGTRYIQAQSIDNIKMCPKPGIQVPLRKVLEHMGRLNPAQQQHQAPQNINDWKAQPDARFNPYDHNMQANHVEHRASLAKSKLMEANDLMVQVNRLRAEAASLDPSLYDNPEAMEIARNVYGQNINEHERSAQNGRPLRSDDFSKAQQQMYGYNSTETGRVPNAPQEANYGTPVAPQNDPYMAAMNEQSQHPVSGQPFIPPQSAPMQQMPTSENKSVDELLNESKSRLDAQLSELSEEEKTKQQKTSNARRGRKKKTEVQKSASAA